MLSLLGKKRKCRTKKQNRTFFYYPKATIILHSVCQKNLRRIFFNVFFLAENSRQGKMLIMKKNAVIVILGKSNVHSKSIVHCIFILFCHFFSYCPQQGKTRTSKLCIQSPCWFSVIKVMVGPVPYSQNWRSFLDDKRKIFKEKQGPVTFWKKNILGTLYSREYWLILLSDMIAWILLPKPVMIARLHI